MPLSVACPVCGTRLRAPDSSAGKRVKCPECGEVVAVPAAAPQTEEIPVAEVERPSSRATIRRVAAPETPDAESPRDQEGAPFTCPLCNATYPIADGLAGRKIKCRQCGVLST